MSVKLSHSCWLQKLEHLENMIRSNEYPDPVIPMMGGGNISQEQDVEEHTREYTQVQELENLCEVRLHYN